MNNLEKLRIEKGISVEELIKVMKIKEDIYYLYVKEDKYMSFLLLKIMATYYNVSIDYLLGITNVKKRYKKSIHPINNHIINRFKSIRINNKISSKTLNKILNITSYVYYEKNNIKMPYHILKKLAYLYDVSVDYLLCFTDECIGNIKIIK